MNYASPLIDTKHLASISTLLLFLWPAVLVGIVALIRWGSLKQRFAFLVLGYLTCTGLELFSRSMGYTFAWARYIGAVPQDQIVAAFVNASLTITVVSSALSIVPVLWLARICQQAAPTSPNQRLERP